mmetsp:Transcript_18139/g.45040  ORF Transcript_18139/g.45040 Transcript_18139/m.45040 type:complete len:205 (+) Transcript_18139:1098-1712(+)
MLLAWAVPLATVAEELIDIVFVVLLRLGRDGRAIAVLAQAFLVAIAPSPSAILGHHPLVVDEGVVRRRARGVVAARTPVLVVVLVAAHHLVPHALLLGRRLLRRLLLAPGFPPARLLDARLLRRPLDVLLLLPGRRLRILRILPDGYLFGLLRLLRHRRRDLAITLVVGVAGVAGGLLLGDTTANPRVVRGVVVVAVVVAEEVL